MVRCPCASKVAKIGLVRSVKKWLLLLCKYESVILRLSGRSKLDNRKAILETWQTTTLRVHTWLKCDLINLGQHYFRNQHYCVVYITYFWIKTISSKGRNYYGRRKQQHYRSKRSIQYLTKLFQSLELPNSRWSLKQMGVQTFK